MEDTISAPQEILLCFQFSPDLPVSGLLNWPHTPRQPGSRKISLAAEEWFSKDLPTTPDIDVARFVFPFSKLCVALDSCLADALKAGNQSVQHPVHERELLPLWVVRVWKWGAALLDAQRLWRSRIVWIEKTAEGEKWGEDFAASVKEAVLAMPSLAPLPGLQRGAVLASRLAENLLSSAWLNDDTINCIGEVILQDVRTSGVAENVVIAPTFLGALLNRPSSAFCTYYAERLLAGNIKKLLMPCNIRNIHWIPAEIDVRTNTISMGDSMPIITENDLPGLIEQIRAFLSIPFPNTTWKVNRTALETGIQKDSHSCGIATLNAIERRVLVSSRRWSPLAPGRNRAQYFLRCAEACHIYVCTTYAFHHQRY